MTHSLHIDSSGAPAARAPLDLWYTRCQVPTAFGFALYRGLFEEEFPAGGPVRFSALQDAGDPRIAQSHFTHVQPRSMRHGSCYPAIWAQANGAHTRVVGLSSLRASQTVLAASQSNIHKPHDLKGKRLLIVSRPGEQIDYLYATTLRIYETALASAGLTFADVELIEYRVDRPFIVDRITQHYQHGAVTSTRSGRTGLWEDSVPALLRGEVDVITCGGSIGTPSLQMQELLGLQIVFDMARVDDDVACATNSNPLVFAIKSDLIEEHPELVRRVLARVVQASELAMHLPAEAIRCIAREQSVSEALAQKAWGDGLYDTLRLDLHPFKVAALKSQVEFLHSIGAIAAPIDVDDWLAPGWVTDLMSAE
jgi:ABC-type nitrate/sulfonate/bicarbonate transport system substrate-binding protein